MSCSKVDRIHLMHDEHTCTYIFPYQWPKKFLFSGVCMKSTLRHKLKKSATATFFLMNQPAGFSSQSVKLRFLALLPARKFQEGNESRDDPTSWGPSCYWNNMRLGGRAVQSKICKYIPPPQPKDPKIACTCSPAPRLTHKIPKFLFFSRLPPRNVRQNIWGCL